MALKRPTGEPPWQDGIDLGTLQASPASASGNGMRIIRAHAAKRVPEEAACDSDRVAVMRAIPWGPIPSRLGFNMPTDINEDDVRDEESEETIVACEDVSLCGSDVPGTIAQTFRASSAIREDIMRHGASVGCTGCNGIDR